MGFLGFGVHKLGLLAADEKEGKKTNPSIAATFSSQLHRLPAFPQKHKFHKFLRANTSCMPMFCSFHSRSLYWCCTCSWLNIARFHGKLSNTWQAILHMAAESLTAGISDAYRLFLGSFTLQKHYKRTMVTLRTWYVFFVFNVRNHLKQMQKMSYTDSDFLYKIKRYKCLFSLWRKQGNVAPWFDLYAIASVDLALLLDAVLN